MLYSSDITKQMTYKKLQYTYYTEAIKLSYRMAQMFNRGNFGKFDESKLIVNIFPIAFE